MKSMLRKILKRKRRGFTVIEAFVGISILLIGLVGPLMLVNSNLQAGRFSRDQITAYYLAQEAIEMVREVRDENFIAVPARAWLTGIPSGPGCFRSVSTTDGCRVDGRPGVGTIQTCTNCETTARLQFDASTGQYGHSGGSPSRFYRYVQMESRDGGSGVIVRVRVGFDTGRYVQVYTTTDYLRDWDPR